MKTRIQKLTDAALLLLEYKDMQDHSALISRVALESGVPTEVIHAYIYLPSCEREVVINRYLFPESNHGRPI